MSRGVDQIERVAFAVVGCVLHLNGVALDRDALFAFQFHVIEHLCLHLALIERVGFSSRRSARVDLPWSIWAMMQKLRMFFIEIE